MKVEDCCSRTIGAVTRYSAVGEVRELMEQYHLTEVVVVEEDDYLIRPIGLIPLEAPGLVPADPTAAAALTAASLMVAQLPLVHEEDDLGHAAVPLRRANAEVAAVVDDCGALVGTLNLDDVVHHGHFTDRLSV